MDTPIKDAPYKPYNPQNIPEANIYTGPGGPDTLNGIPLYADESRTNPQLNRFVVQGCKDVWAAILFIAVVLTTLVWGSYNMATYKLVESNSSSSIIDDPDNSIFGGAWSAAIKLAIIFAASVGAACFSLMLLKCFPKQLIYIANIFTVVMMLIGAIVSFAKGVIFLGVMLLIMSLLHALWLYLVRRRIPFSAELLKASSIVLSQHKAIFLFNFFLSIVCGVYMFFWGTLAMPPVDHINRGVSSTGDTLLLILFMLFLFWVAQVVPNLMHVTTAGVVATWYFAGESNMPKNPTLQSFKRATTTSFGSICFGSLIVAIIRLLRWLADSALQNENAFVRCIVLCFIQCLENLVEYFNTYAFVHVAVYGCGYIEAAKRTWALCKQCFFAAYFNDALIAPTLGLLTFGVSVIIGLAAGLILTSVVFGIVAFFLSVMVHSLFFTAVESAVVTIFVCFAEMPEGLQQSSPFLYAALHEADQNGTHNNAPRP